MSVKSALRALQILEAFAQARRPLVLSELARAIDEPRSSCLALLGTLADKGYLCRAGDEARYYPTRRWIDQARLVADHDPVALHVRASLERLRDSTGETAIDAVLSDSHSLYLDVVESDELVRHTARVGDTMPLNSSASGRALLAVLGDDQRKALVGTLFPARSEQKGRFNRRALLETVEAEAIRGWSLNLGEYRPDVTSVAAGFDLHGTAHALVVAAPYHRVEQKVERIGRLLRSEAGALGARLR